MNPTTRCLLAASFATAAGSAAAAQEPSAPASTAIREGWYVAPMATFMSPDSERCEVDDGFGASLALGHRGETASVEVWGQFLGLKHGRCDYTVPDSGDPPDGDLDSDPDPFSEPAGEVDLNGGGIALLVGPFAEQWYARMYGLVGIGVLQRKDHPHYADDETTIIGDLGAGYLQPLRLWGRDFAVRLEARYRFDVQPPPHPDDHDPAPPHSYNDVIVNLGVQVPLSRAVEPAAAPEPVGVVAAPAGDSDNDGVTDDRDQCPDTPPNSYVNNTGCPAPLAVAPTAPAFDSGPVLETAKAGDKIVLKGVTFETGKARLRADSATILDGVAETLQKRPELRVEIGGHTDDRGADAYNQSLSEQRAQAVLDYLVGKGVDATRLSSVGYGEAQPVDSNDTAEGRERNRRVELKVLGQAQTSQPDTGEGS
jgi:outer membrane protein OmpA-like peptidoglycan-associated protein